jgi:hypothetical protein
VRAPYMGRAPSDTINHAQQRLEESFRRRKQNPRSGGFETAGREGAAIAPAPQA